MENRASLAFLCLCAAGCNYHVGTLYEYKTLAVPMFDNKTERRDLEFDLTRQVIRELSRQGIQVDPSADYELQGEIYDIQQPVVVDDRRDNPRVSSFYMAVHYKIVARKDNKIVKEGNVTESAAFSSLRGQGLESAQSEVFDRISKSIVSKLEKGW
jgi:hypothetical protein